MARYICKHCKFKCDLKAPVECPYCGKGMLEKEKSASELLDEIEKVLEE